jgi:hypothetical protein
MQSWGSEELKDGDLGDIRLNKHLFEIVEDLSTQPDASVRQASGDFE